MRSFWHFVHFFASEQAAHEWMAEHAGSFTLSDRVPGLRHDPAGDGLVHEALRRCERSGLLSSKRVRSGRRYELTAAGRVRLRADRRFLAALLGVPLRR